MAALHILLYLIPDLHLRSGEAVRQRLEELSDLRLIPEDEPVFRTVLFVSQPPQRKDKHEKFFKDKPSSRLGKLLFSVWKMHFHDRVFIGDKSIFFHQTLRQDILPGIHMVKGLAHCFYDRIVAESCRQPVDRLHCISLLFILGRRVVDIRMFHDKAVPPSHDPSPQRKRASLSERIPQKRHPEPDHLQRSGEIFEIQRRHLHIPIPRYLDPAEHSACHRTGTPLTGFSDRDRILKYLIRPRIIADKVSHRAHANLFEQLFRFLPDSLQFTDL